MINGYTYGGAAQGALIDKVIYECAVVAKRFNIRRMDFDDVVHDSMIALLSALDRYEEKRKNKLWSYVQHRVRGAAVDSCKKLHAGVSQDTPETTTHGKHTASGAHELLCLSEDMLRVKQAVERLPVRQLRVIKLRFGLAGDKPQTLETVAVLLNVTEGTVRNEQRRALLALREVMNHG
jgi:RNA polymerase sigma factor (sigma-70 family)